MPRPRQLLILPAILSFNCRTARLRSSQPSNPACSHRDYLLPPSHRNVCTIRTRHFSPLKDEVVGGRKTLPSTYRTSDNREQHFRAQIESGQTCEWRLLFLDGAACMPRKFTRTTNLCCLWLSLKNPKLLLQASCTHNANSSRL